MVKSSTLSQIKLLRRHLIIIMLAWTIAVAASLAWTLKQQAHTNNTTLKVQVEAIHAINMEYRNWIIHNGGIYAPVTPSTPPSQWLSHIPDRDVTTPSGKKLTLLNSSYVFRLVQERMLENGANVRMHIASLHPINPTNKADLWEEQALKSFAKGLKEQASIDVMNDGKSYFRYMKPMVTDSYCMKCHARYGDKIGDIRGGVSISLPVDDILAAANNEQKSLIVGHGLIWGLGLLGLFIGGRRQRTALLAVEESEAQVTLLTNSIAHAIYGIDLEGRCTFANDACISMLGYNNQSELLGKEMHTLMHHSRKDGSACTNDECKILNALKTGQAVTVEHEMFGRKNGATFPACYWAYPVTLDDEIQGCVVTLMDITEQLEVKDELKRSKALLDSMIENIPVMIFLKGAEDLRFELFNSAGEELLGYSRENLIGKNDYDLFPKEQADNFVSKDRSVLENRKLLEIPEEPIKVADGSNRWLHTFKIGLYDENNKPTHLLGASLDITDRKLAEDRLRESEARLAEAQRMAHLGHWELDLTTSTLVWSDEVYRIFEVSPDNFPHTYTAFLERIHPDDREAVNTSYNESLKNHTPFQIEHRILMQDGRIKYLFEKCETIFDNFDKPIRSKGTVLDITTLKQAEHTLREHQKVLEKTLEGTIHTVTMAVELRDPYTAGHQRRVSDLSVLIAQKMELDENRVHGVKLGALIHDIGKIGVPAEILSRPYQLTEVELRLVQEHAVMGYNILKEIQFPWPVAEIAHQHHERMNGTGYPGHLKGDAILLEARIVAVADVIESMASHRPYRASLGMQEAINEIQKNRGTLYDEHVVDACLKILQSGFKFE